MNNEKRFISIKEACEYTGFGETKMRELVRAPNDFTLRIGNKYFIDKTKFDKYIENCMKYKIAIL